MVAATMDSGEREIWLMFDTPVSSKPSSPVTVRAMSDCFTVSMVNLPSNRRMNGPSEAEALLSLALPSRRAERPSTSRRFTSLPSVAPTMVPFEFTTIATSGSGLFHSEIGRMPTSAP